MDEHDGPIYQSKSVYKNNKVYNFNELVWIFDCPHCDTIRDHHSRDNAITHMDMHIFHTHPEKHVPLISNGEKVRVAEAYYAFRIRAFSPVGRIRPARRE